eukprot:m.136543 g.136543  ORF g.136543 m.136543 type:complete len:409 (-) comp23962_c1_seq2:171-1397(-)
MSKYSSLPGVVEDQPDHFEVGADSLPEGPVGDPKEGTQDVAAKDVSELKIDPSKAHDRFKGRTLDASGVDFSNSLDSARQGYLNPSPFEILSKVEDETPEQKFQRLQHDVKMFLEEIEAIKQSSSAHSKEEHASSVTLAQQVKYLQEQLQQVQLEQLLGVDENEPIFMDPQGDMTKRLMTEISKFKNLSAASGMDKASLKPGDQITYELHYKPEAAKFAQVTKIAELEKRIEELEKLIGSEPIHVLSTAAELDVAEVSLQKLVSTLNSRIATLSIDNMSDLDRRLQSVLNQLEFAKKKQTTDSGETAKQVAELYDLSQRWDAIATSVPVVVNRLKALKQLHEHGSEFGRSLTHLETVQEQMSATLADQATVLQTVEHSFKQNLATIEKNFASMEKRIADLNKNLARIR